MIVNLIIIVYRGWIRYHPFGMLALWVTFGRLWGGSNHVLPPPFIIFLFSHFFYQLYLDFFFSFLILVVFFLPHWRAEIQERKSPHKHGNTIHSCGKGSRTREKWWWTQGLHHVQPGENGGSSCYQFKHCLLRPATPAVKFTDEPTFEIQITQNYFYLFIDTRLSSKFDKTVYI